MSDKQKSDFVNRVNQAFQNCANDMTYNFLILWLFLWTTFGYPFFALQFLDALELDKEVFVVLKQQVLAVFKSLEPSLLSRLEPEIDAVLSFLIWNISVRSTGSTFGQQMLGLRLKEGKRFDKRSTFWSFLLIPVIIRYFRERSRSITAKLRLWSADRDDGSETTLATYISNTVRWVQLTITVAELANFLLFLRQGRYPSLVMRLLDLQIAPQDGHRGHRPVGYLYVTRELLWHSFIELLVFVLPLINYHYMRRVVLGFLFWGRKFSPGLGDNKPQPLTLATRCEVCSRRPILPHRMGCQHVFCYYCLKANLTADPQFNCPTCSFRATAPDAIRPA